MNHPALVQKHPTPLWDGVVRVGSLCLNHPEGVVRVGSRRFAVLEPPRSRFKHSEPLRTYRKHTTTERARCVGCFCTKAGWFKHFEPHRTYTILTITELARCVGCFCSSSGWLKHSEPTRTTPAQCSRCVGH